VLTRLEQVLNSSILEELRGLEKSAQGAGPIEGQ
jgi:hypothetical protein